MCFLSEKIHKIKTKLFLGFSCDLKMVCLFDNKNNEGRIKVWKCVLSLWMMVHERNLWSLLGFSYAWIWILYISLIMNMKFIEYIHVFACLNDTWMNKRKLETFLFRVWFVYLRFVG